MPGEVIDTHLHTRGTTRTLCGLVTATTQWAEHEKNVTCELCLGIVKPADTYRRVDFKVRDSGAYVTVYQRVGETPRLDLNFFDGDRSMDQAILRAQTLMRAHELAAHWNIQTRRSVGTEPSPAA